MNIVFGVDDNYVKYCGATIASVLCNRKIDTDNDKDKKFVAFKRIQNFEIEIYTSK
jgi:lipopolysaccharide biosynthesis glycosyltransferase